MKRERKEEDMPLIRSTKKTKLNKESLLVDELAEFHNIGDIKMVICFLMTDYANFDIWEQWGKGVVGFASHPLPKLKEKTPHSIPNPIETSWSSDTLVVAEMKLYEYALERYPFAEFFMFVSGDTVPVRSYSDVIDHFNSDPRSQFPNYAATDKNSVIKKKSGTKPKFVKQYAVSDQFKCLNRKDLLFLMEHQTDVHMLLKCKIMTPRRVGNFAYDEWVIPTILLSRKGGSRLINQQQFIGLIVDDTHAKMLGVGEFEDLLQDIIDNAPSVLVARKVGPSTVSEVQEILQSRKII